MSDVTFNMATNSMEVLHRKAEPWRVTLVDTGESTQTGGRLKRVQEYLEDVFCMTYGDGLANINIRESLNFHRSQGKNATVTAVQPPARFGALQMSNSTVTSFLEKPLGDGGYINGGFFVLNKKALSYISDDTTLWEKEPLESLVNEGQLSAFRHDGFWQPMDTLRDKTYLENLWATNVAPWKLWDQ